MDPILLVVTERGPDTFVKGNWSAGWIKSDIVMMKIGTREVHHFKEVGPDLDLVTLMAKGWSLYKLSQSKRHTDDES